MAKLKIGNCIKITKGKYKGTKADITHIGKGSYIAGNSKATFRVYDGWVKKVKCPQIN